MSRRTHLCSLLLAAGLLSAACRAPAPREAQPPAPATPVQQTVEPGEPAEPATNVLASQALPFLAEDVQAIAASFTTVGDYVQALAPSELSWSYEGEATGNTFLYLYTMDADAEVSGIATLRISVQGGINGEADGEAVELPAEVLALPAHLVEVDWLDVSYPLPYIRGVGIGAPAADVVGAFFSYNAEEPEYGAEEINPAIDGTWLWDDTSLVGARVYEEESDDTRIFAYGWCTLNNPQEWREYYLLEYIIEEGIVGDIILSYSTDAE